MMKVSLNPCATNSILTNSTIFEMMPTYNFAGDAVTFLGLIGVVSTFVIVVTSFRRYYNSPLRK